MDNRQFGTTAEGTQATLYTIENGCGMRAQVTDFGATVVSLIVKDKAGKDTDVVLGYDDVASYQKPELQSYCGCEDCDRWGYRRAGGQRQ